MGKLKYYIVLAVLIVVAVAFKYQSIVGNKKVETIKIAQNTTIEINYSEEIKETLFAYDSILSNEIREVGTVGAAVVITYKGQIALLKCFGIRKAGQKNPVNKNTVFRLASVSKTVTGVLAGILADENIINLDDKIVDYIPDFNLKTSESTNSLSIRHILSHTSGLIPHAYDLMVEDHVPLEKIMARLNEVDITAAPGKLYGYQNVMFSIYDPITEIKTQKSFNSVINEKVFTPFGMKNASTGYEAFKNNNNKAFPHYGGDRKFKAMRLNDRYYNTTPAAGVNASISDLGQFLLTLTDKNHELFSKNAYDLVFTPQVISPLKRTYFRSWDKVDSKEYSIGWRIVNYKNRKVAYHGGYVLGYRAEIAFCEEEEVGIAYLTNSPNSSVSKKVPTFLNLLFENKDKLVQENNIANKTPKNKS